MRRWTVLVVSHDSDAPRSYSITERAVRLAAAGALVVGLVALIGLGTIVASLGTRGEAKSHPMASAGSMVPSPEVDSLRRKVGALQGLLDTIRTQDARLQREVGLTGLDTTKVLSRFFARLPRFLRGNAGTRPERARPIDPRDSLAIARERQLASASADSLLSHAGTLAERLDAMMPKAWFALDTLEVLSLRPESLAVALGSGRDMTREGKMLRWKPRRSAAVLAGFAGEVAMVLAIGAEHCEVEVRARGGLVGRVRASGRAVVRRGDRVRVDQPLVVVIAPSPDSVRFAAYELKRNGVVLDPARVR